MKGLSLTLSPWLLKPKVMCWCRGQGSLIVAAEQSELQEILSPSLLFFGLRAAFLPLSCSAGYFVKTAQK